MFLNTFLFLFLLCHKKSSLRQFCRFIFLSERLGLCAAGMLDSIGFPMEKSFVGKVESQNIVFKYSAFRVFQILVFVIFNFQDSFWTSQNLLIVVPEGSKCPIKVFRLFFYTTYNLFLFLGFMDKIAKLNTVACFN